MLNRDSWILTLTIIGSVLGVILAQFDVLPAGWQQYQGALTILSSIIGVVAGILRTSPLAGNNTPPKMQATALGGLVSITKLPD